MAADFTRTVSYQHGKEFANVRMVATTKLLELGGSTVEDQIQSLYVLVCTFYSNAMLNVMDCEANKRK